MVRNWVKKTPDNFKFTAKFPKVITHDKHLVDVNEEVYTFLDNMEPLQDSRSPYSVTTFNANNARIAGTKRSCPSFGWEI